MYISILLLAKDTHTIEVLKAGGATIPEIPYQEKDALLMKYAEEGCAGGVLIALKAGANVNHKDSVLDTSLHYAAGAGRLSVVQALVSAGAELNPRNSDLWSPLHWAAARGRLSVVQSLVITGAELNPKDSYCLNTPLHWAAYRRHLSVVQGLVCAGAELNPKDKLGCTPLALAKFYGKHQVQAWLQVHGGQ